MIPLGQAKSQTEDNRARCVLWVDCQEWHLLLSFTFFKLLRKSKFQMEVLLKQCILCEGRNELDTRTLESIVSNGQAINPVEQLTFCFGLTWLL